MLLPVTYQAIVERALSEDLGSGDLTTESTIDPAASARATAVARTPLVVCGGPVFFDVFRRLDPEVRCTSIADEGDFVQKGAMLWSVSGNAQALLMAERVALNFAQRMSGVATLTRSFVGHLPEGSKTRIVDTRKTTPGLRILERYAVRVGGGHNHRDNLGTAVLIKDNHIIAAGGIGTAVGRARERAPHTTRIEVEVANLSELEQALQAGADIIMLDNFSMEDTGVAVSRAKGRAILEASGRVSAERIKELAALGLDIISVGALTHSAPAADIALDLEVG